MSELSTYIVPPPQTLLIAFGGYQNLCQIIV